MPQIVGQRQGLDQIFVQSQRPADRAGDRGHLQRVRQPRAMVVAQLAGKDLRLRTQPAIRRTVDDAVAVALERAAVRMPRLGDDCGPADRLLCMAYGASSS